MLKLSHIKKGYNKKDVLIDVDYTFQEGNIYSLLGGAGAGRTTLFECICGDVPVDEGAIEIPPKAKIFYASKQSILPVYITGYEFISMLCDISDENIKPEAVFEKVGLSIGQRDKLIVDYTFEEKKLLQLASIYVINPYIILFDTIVLNNGEFNYIDKQTMAIPEIRKAVLDILGEADNEIV